jgi:DNA mismatch endonuclease (patch repair protein)
LVDIFSDIKRSEIMSRIGPKDSKPEIFVRKLVHSLGYRFRLHRKDLPGTPDLVFPKYKKVIFVHGCFWHGHQNCNRSKMPDTNKKFWENKIKKNIENDDKNLFKLKELGWDTLTIWECHIKKRNISRMERKISDFLTQ